MVYRACLAALVLGVVTGFPAWSEVSGGKKAEDGRIARLIAQLGSRKFAERQKATRALDQLGSTALPALAKAARSPDPEIGRRCRELAKAIGRRLEVEKLLAPTSLHLVYKDKPVTEAVADLAKKTGFYIAIEGDKAKLAGRKITLDTGKTTFWQAFDAFCQKAQLTERSLLQAAGKNTAPSGGYQTRTFKKDIRLVLVDAKAQTLPTHYVHGVRIRTLPASTSLEGLSVAKGSRAFVLEATLEPKTRLRKVIGLRVYKAVDEKGRPVTASPQLLDDPDDSNPYYYPYPSTPSSYQARLQNGMDEGNFRRLPVLVKAARTVKEFRGALIAEVQKPAGVLFTVENVLKSAGKSFETSGGTLTVQEASQEKNGPVTFKISTTYTLNGFVGGIQMGNGVVRIRRNQGGEWETVGIETANLKLFDTKGRGIRLAHVRQQGANFTGRGITQEMVLTYQPEKGQAAPAKLVYYGVGTAILEISFRLTNVSLP
jgi:hypothetical protein